MKFRFIDSGENNPYLNMAIDEALLLSKEPVIRFYRWKPSTVSIGYFQSMENEININKCRQLGIGFVRRMTGGKAVYHDQELTYSFICNESLLSHSILESYKQISKGIVCAMKSLGLNPQMNEIVDKAKVSSNCFNQPSYYELTINNKKFVGSAQKRKGGKILQHGSILLDVDFDTMCTLFTVDSAEFRHETEKRVTSMSNELGKAVSYGEVSALLKKGFEETFNGQLIPSGLTSDETILAHTLAKEKYATNEWNFMK